mmetsp:Transcript_139571/g.446619  ORF Transcript_139571/g.446619 Transcript_139571/m.446619 type:complete len:225 (+) Transcript_139571:412-1086(+)
MPCPFCREERGQVGKVPYIKDACMVSSCDKQACIDAQKARQQRLRDGPARICYHACRPTDAASILASGKFLEGACGSGGGALYFTRTARENIWKTDFKGDDRVILKCRVKRGKEYPGRRSEPLMTFARVIELGNYDSCILDHAGTGHPVPDAPVPGTTKENRQPGEDLRPGYEFLVYACDQIDVLGMVDRDIVDSVDMAVHERPKISGCELSKAKGALECSRDQ